jgi:Putative restriction endonuclease
MATVVEQEIPPLQFGDKLTREEFFRIWKLHPEIRKAELIGGMVYMASPVSIDHGHTKADVGTWLSTYRIFTPGTDSGHNATMCMLDDSPQPDLNLYILPECGGRSWVEDDLLWGSPEALAEVCRSSAAYDLHVKLELYEQAKVQEYLAILLYEQEIRWHVLSRGRYKLLAPESDGIWRSRVFPGLWLDGAALLARNMVAVLATLQKGLDSREHKAFVKELARRKKKAE